MSNHRLQAMEWVLVNAYKIVNLTYLSIPSNYKHKSSSISIHLHMTNNPLIFSQKLQNSHKSVIHAWIKHTYTLLCLLSIQSYIYIVVLTKLYILVVFNLSIYMHSYKQTYTNVRRKNIQNRTFPIYIYACRMSTKIKWIMQIYT